MNRRLLRPVVPLVSMVALLVAGWGAMRWMQAHQFSAADLVSEILHHEEPRFAWQSVDHRHWQASSLGISEQTTTLVALEPDGEGCPLGMVRAKGAFHSDNAAGHATGAIERLQDAA